MKKKLKKNLFYNKFLGVLIKKGKKSKAKKILDSVFFKISKITKLSSNLILYRIFLNLNTFVEIRRVRSKAQKNLIPFPISYSRRIFLILKWILFAVSKDKRRISLTNKLFFEIFKIIHRIPSESLNLKNLNNLQAYSNKANIHFRW